ncbi:hypothetical protein [Paenibacillus agricola]|uniref:Nucleoside 2-deoxyribosyltransferase n=1 Tax=Paenibacillus agricola TaxID=2716264 RepID=A0ABX0JEK8_9BACL|nr:hypothetical protein [Paenibacillus agricola]NHN33133.1 hypothetical protein [Paenibacillus agricola]
MHIYATHSNSFDFKEEFYNPLVQLTSLIPNIKEIVLPHKDSAEQFDTLRYFKNSCALVIAEASYPSTGSGIELGWASLLNIKIVVVHHISKKPSSSYKVISDDFIVYENSEDLTNKLYNFILR